jgi:hypothetical protein
MHKNINWANKELPGLSHDELNELTNQYLTRVENGKQTITQNYCFEGRQKAGLKNKETGHIQNLGKKWGRVNALKGGTTQEIRLMGAQAMKEKSSIPVLQLSLDGILIKEWSSMNEAGRNGFNVSQISGICNNKPKMKTHKGFLWKFKLI